MTTNNMSSDWVSTKNKGKFISGLAFDGSAFRTSNQGRFESPDEFVPGDQSTIGVNQCNGNNFYDPDDDGDWEGTVYGE
jgi:hypothetical protein